VGRSSVARGLRGATTTVFESATGEETGPRQRVHVPRRRVGVRMGTVCVVWWRWWYLGGGHAHELVGRLRGETRWCAWPFPQAGRGARGVEAEKPRSATTNHARTHATIKSCGASASASSSAALLAGARVPRAVDIGGDSGTLACVGASWEGRQAGVGGGRRGTLPRQAGKRNARAFLRVDHTRGQVPSQHSCRRQPWWPQLAS